MRSQDILLEIKESVPYFAISEYCSFNKIKDCVFFFYRIFLVSRFLLSNNIFLKLNFMAGVTLIVEDSHFSSLVILQLHKVLILIVTTFLIGNWILLYSYLLCFNESILGPLETARFNHIYMKTASK